MCANNYQNLFKTFVANLCGGNFVSTFDKQKIDGIVTKSEFQEIMYLDETKKNFANFAGWNGEENNTTGYRDLVNSFWNSFDINQEDGKIKGTGLFNLNGLDNTESTDLQTDLNIHKRIADQLVTIQKYPNTYNYLLNQLVKELGNSELESLPEKINETLNQVIKNNSSAIKNILLKDVSNISLKDYVNYNIPGFYDVENDQTLTELLANSVSQPGDIASLDDITEFFNESTNPTKINEYFNNTTYDKNNYYQKALMQKNIYDEVYNYINNSLPSLKNSKMNYDKTIKEEIENYINSYKAENGVNLDDLIAEIKTKFFATDEDGNSKGYALYDYLYTLSLCDLKEENNVQDKIKDAEGNETSTFESHLYNLIGGKDGFGSDATKIIEWLANNDIGNPDYQKLIQEIAEEILKNGKNLTASEIHILIYNKLGVKSTDGILSQEQIDEILKVVNEDDVETTPTDKKLSITDLSFENLCSYGKLDAAYNNGTTRQLESTFTKNINNLVELGYDRNKLENVKTNILTKIRNSMQILIDDLSSANGSNYFGEFPEHRGIVYDENSENASFVVQKNNNKITKEEFYNNEYCSSGHLITVAYYRNFQDSNYQDFKITINGAQLAKLFVSLYNN